MTDDTTNAQQPADEVSHRIIQAIAETLDLDDAERQILSDKVGYKRLKKWTSARHAEIMVAIEDEFDIEIAAEEIARLSDVAKIEAYVRHSTT